MKPWEKYAQPMPQERAMAGPWEKYAGMQEQPAQTFQQNSPQIIQARNKAVESQLSNQPSSWSDIPENIGRGIIQGGKDVVMGGAQTATDLLGRKYPDNETIQNIRSLMPEAQANSNIAYQAATGNSNAAGLGRIGMQGASYSLMGGPVVGGMISGATQPSEQQTTPDEAFASRAKGAAIGGAIGAVAPAVVNKIGEGVSTIAQGVNATGKKGLQAIEDGMGKISGAVYDQLDDVGVTLNETGVNKLANNIKDELEAAKININPEQHPVTSAALNALQNRIMGTNKGVFGNNESILNATKSTPGQLGLGGLDVERQALSDAKYGSADATAASVVRKAIDNVIQKGGLTTEDLANGTPENLDLLGKAQDLWSQKKKFELVSNVIKDADGNQTKIKNGLNALLKSRNEMKISGFNDAEIDGLEKAANSSFPEKALKTIGILGFDPQKHPYIFAGEAAGAMHNPIIAGGALVGGTIANQLSKYMARGKAEQLIQTIQNGGVPKEIGKLPPKLVTQLMQTFQRQEQQ